MRFVASLVLVLVATVAADARASSLGSVVGQIGAAMHPADGNAVPTGALVVAAPLTSDVPPVAGHGDDLALRVASLVAGKIPGARASTRVASLDDARAIASRFARLVYVHVEVVKSQLRVTADAYPVVHNVWDRARLPPPPPSDHAYAAAPIDAEVRAFFPPIALVLTSIVKATGADADVMAAACGDLDGDGGAELVLVSRERVSIARLASSKVRVERAVPWSALAKRASVPLREPLGGASVELGRALVGTSDRGAVVVGESLDAPHGLAGGLPIGAGLCAPISTRRLAFEGVTTACDVAPAAGSHESFDAAAAFDLVSPAGRDQIAIATSAAGKLQLRIDGVEKASFDDAGAQVALLDADLDGAPEIAFSSDLPDDFITVATVGERGSRVLARIPAAAGVRALAACPPMNGGGAALVAVVGSEVWLVR